MRGGGWTGGRGGAYNGRVLRCALIVALASPPAGAGAAPPAVPWGPLPGQPAPASAPVSGDSTAVPADRSQPTTPAPGATSVAPGGTIEGAAAPGVTTGPQPAPPAPRPLPPVAPPEEAGWKRVVSPIASAVLPGVGQMINREGGKGAGFLLGALTLGAGAFALWRAGNGLDGAAAGAHGRTYNTEVISAAGYGLLTGGLHLLYMAQVMDAYAGAVGKRTPKPHTRHKLALELTRMATVGLRAGDPAAQFYADWNIGVLGQVARRFSVGLGDIGLKFGPGRAVLQAGPKLQYRFVERGRVWLSAAAGAIVQGAFASGPAIVPEGEKAPRTAVAAIIPYGQLDLRLFILDRWSINIVPRVSAPLLSARYYRDDGAIPRRAATLEIGTGMGVYF